MKKVLLFLFIIIINSPNLFSQINLSTSNITSNNAIVNWDNGGCSSGSYILRYRENGAAWSQNSPITITNTGGSQSYNLNNLTTNTTYNWRIKCGSGGLWVYGPNFSTAGPCLSSLSQTISSFSPNPLTGYMQNSTCSLTIANTGTCDLNIRPQFIISNDNSLINQGDIVIEWYNPAFSFWANIPYNIDNNGNAYGFWSPTSNSSHDSTGYEFQNGSAAQTIPVRVRFMNPNNSPPNGAPYGVYSAAWTTYEVDSLGNIIQSLSNTDTVEINLVDCSIFTIDNIISNNVTCFGGNDGDAVVVVSSGSGNYNYLWSNSQTSENIQSLTAGTFTVTVTDLYSGCLAHDSVLINEPLQISASYTSNNVTCNGGNDGVISITTTNGSGLFEYNWTSHTSINGSSSATNLSADTYVINVIDSICSDVIPLSITISEPLPLSIDSTFSTNNSSCDPAICNGTFGITVSGETPPYSFTWNQGGYTGSLANDLCSGTYNITVTDAEGCNSIFESATIIDNPFVPTLCLSLINNVTCNGASNGSVLATIVNGSCGGGTSNLTYCNSYPGDADYSNIELVSIIGDNGTSIANNTSNLCDLYEDYTSQSVTLSPGSTYNLIVNLGSCNAGQFQIDSGAVFIDWNQDGDFDDLDEKISSFAGVQSPTSNSITINVPNNAVGGPTRMRVVSQSQAAGSLALTACDVGVYDLTNFIFTQPWFGATEDYTINVAAPYLQGTYLWSNGSTDSLNNTLSAGIQTCTITDLNNCTLSESITISEPSALNFLISTTNILCNGGNNGTAEITNISGGTAPYLTNWFGIDTSSLSAGTYSYLVLDNNGCVDSGSVTIAEPLAISVSSSTTDVLCNGENSGTAEITNISGGTLPYSTNWFSVDTTSLSVGTYSYLVSDNNGCVDSGSVFIDEPAVLIATDSSTNVSCNGGNDGGATVYISGGTQTYILNAFGYSVPLLGSTSYTTPVGVGAGNYPYFVSDGNSCSTTVNNILIGEPNPLNVIINSTNVSCFGGNDGTVEITNISGGTLPYSTNWFGVDTTNLSNGNYSYQVIDFNLCSINGSVSINQPNPLNVTLISSSNITDCSNPNGSIDIDVSGGNGNYFYDWSNGQTTEDLVNLSAGNYSVTVNDNLNCSITFGPVNLTSPSPINWTINTTNYNGFEVSCNGESDGEIYVATTGGTGTITYNWPNLSSNNDTVSNLSAGSYTVIATDDANCTSTQLIELDQPSQIIIEDSIVQLNCDTASSLFSAELIISGGLPSYNINWFGANNNSLTIGTYPYLVSDLNGCSISNSITLVPSTPVTMIGYHNDVLCFGGSSGTAAFVVTDGVPPYSYLWSNGDTNSTATNLTAGMYYCTVTDANNCTYLDSILVSQPSSALAVSINALNDIQCFGDSVGAAEINSISGGVSPYDIQWENGITSNLASNLIGGYNIFSIIDDNGCVLIDSILINTNSEIQATYNIPNILCNGDTTGEIQISSNNVTGGIPGTNGYFLQWINLTNGLSSTNINPLITSTTILSGFTAGTHILVYTDSLGCFKNDSVTISQPDAISVNIDSIQHVECWGDLTGFAQLTISGGITDYEFYNNTYSTLVPLTGGQVNYSFINHPAGTHTYIITDDNGCIYIDSLEILHLADSLHFVSNVSDYNGVNISCKGYSDGWISIDTILGGFAPYNFNWSNGDTSTYIDSISVGWYTANLFDSFGCTFTETFQIIEPAFALQTNMDSIRVSCFNYCDGMIIANNLSNFASNSGTAPYNYHWFDDNSNLVGTNDTLMNICDGNYSLTVTDANGCLNYETASISQPDKIVVFIDSIANVTINGLANGAITIQVSGGDSIYSYNWYGLNGFTSSNQNIFNLFAGSYYLIVNDQVGCYSDTVFVSISEPPAVSVNVDSVQTTFTTSCFGECDANIIINPVLSPIEPFSILWTGPNGFNSQDQNLYNLCGGIYILHIITSSDTTMFTFDIYEPDSLDVNIFANNIICYGETALATAYTYGGTLQYQFLWSNNSNNISTFLYEGTHYLTVTDANGCTAYDSITLNQPDSMWISSVTTSDVSCNNLSNGSIDNINIEGGIAPFIFSINQFASQQNNEIFNNLSAGNYTLEVIDSLGCETSIDLEIDNGTLFEVMTTNPTNYADTVDCNGVCNGFVQFDYNGENGLPDPSWQQWSGGNINGDLCPGTYSVTFTDSIGCQATINNLVIFDAPVLNIDSTSSISPTCFNNANDGSAFIQGAGYYGNQQVSGTQWPVQYSWPNIDPFPFLGNNPINLEPGTYTCYITHGPSGCVDSISVTVNNNSIPFLVEIVFDGINLTKGLTQPSGVTVTNYEWNTNESTQSILPQSNGQYWLIVTDDQGCISDTAFYNLTSLNNNFADKNLLTIYPNPTNGYIFVESEKNISEVLIYNNLGELVLNDNNLNKYKSLDLSNFTKGIYYIKLNINNEIVKRKIILK
tara:strand:- start:78823 stop:86139 length:7317 start_codon:yes stop_codon:yes gene_type:complete